MALSRHEIFPGSVSFLDGRPANDKRFEINDDFKTLKVRPFVCLQSDKDNSVWIGLTSSKHGDRIPIYFHWRCEGDDLWRERLMFMCDGETSVKADHRAIMEASLREAPFYIGTKRPFITTDGVRQMLHEVNRRGGVTLQQAALPILGAKPKEIAAPVAKEIPVVAPAGELITREFLASQPGFTVEGDGCVAIPRTELCLQPRPDGDWEVRHADAKIATLGTTDDVTRFLAFTGYDPNQWEQVTIWRFKG